MTEFWPKPDQLLLKSGSESRRSRQEQNTKLTNRLDAARAI